MLVHNQEAWLGGSDPKSFYDYSILSDVGGKSISEYPLGRVFFCGTGDSAPVPLKP